MNIVELFLENPIWQWLWMIAMLILFYWLSNKDDNKTLKIIMISMSVWIVHFIVMWIYSAALVTLIWLARIFLSIRYKRNYKVFLMIVFTTITLWYFTYTDFFSILPIIASCISAYWYFFFEKIKLRIFMIFTSFFWLTFSFWNWLIWWVINEIIAQVILLTAMYKMVHEEWRNIFIIDAIFSKFRKPKYDTWRYIYIFDYINRKNLKEKIINSLNKIKNFIKIS